MTGHTWRCQGVKDNAGLTLSPAAQVLCIVEISGRKHIPDALLAQMLPLLHAAGCCQHPSRLLPLAIWTAAKSQPTW